MANESQTNPAKISGYLEKKGKLRMVSSWKKYWFVLEGRLLLYYRSKAEYDALGPCKGSITLGTPCNIKPALASSCIFQIETRTSTATLRAENRYEQDKWMQAILSALNQTSGCNQAKMSHFRYSADNLVPTPTKNDNNKQQVKKPLFSRQNTMPDRLKQVSQKDKLLFRLQALGAQTYGGSLQTINKITQKISPKFERCEKFKKPAVVRDEDFITNENTLYGTVTECKKVEPITQEAVSEIEVLVENCEYIKTDEEAPKRQNHIYQEIEDLAAIPTIIVENTEYCTSEKRASSNVDHNENNVEELSTYSEPIYRQPKEIYDVPSRVSEIYEELQVEPQLPPRRKAEDETSSQSSSEHKPKKLTRLRKLAQMVSERRKEGLKGSFLVKMMKRMRRQDSEEADSKASSSADVDEITVLSNLQKLLDSKKQQIEDKIKSSASKEDIDVRSSDNYDYAEDSDKVMPQLPPKQKHLTKPSNSDPGFDYVHFCTATALNIPRPKLIQKMKRHRRSVETIDEKLKTIDEILDDLDTDQNENCSRHKVKQLVEKFNEYSHCDEVELRRKSVQHDGDQRHSDDLNRLLAELSKVTNAPILAPGATSSLITTPTTEEWKTTTSERKRRFSEPDYDVPRPHSSLQILPSNDVDKEPVMQPTRFFGPVLIDSEMIGAHNSITPDSLEIDQTYNHQKPPQTCSSCTEEDRSLFSYTSHNYVREKKLSSEDVYGHSKSQGSMRSCHRHQRGESSSGAKFEDSLELADS